MARPFPEMTGYSFSTGGAEGATVEKYLVLPHDMPLQQLGVRGGAYATELHMTLGGQALTVPVGEHEQKIVSLAALVPREVPQVAGEQKVRLISFTATIPAGDVWVKFFSGEQDEAAFRLFGGETGMLKKLHFPAEPLDQHLLKALERTRYIDIPTEWRIDNKVNRPVLEVALAAGRFTAKIVVDGKEQGATIAVSHAGARAGRYQQEEEIYQLQPGVQTIRYTFMKKFAPHQMNMKVRGIAGKCVIQRVTITPDYEDIFADLRNWQTAQTTPPWLDEP